MKYEPLPHQIADSDALLEYNHALLWADAGTGKTVTAMEALRKGAYDKVMVVCPKVAVPMWKEELEAHMGKSRLHGGSYFAKHKTTSRFKKGEAVGPADALVATFGLVRTWMNSADKGHTLIRSFVNGGRKGDRHWQDPRGDNTYRTALIVDEAHYLKSFSAKQTRAVFGPRITPTPHALMQHFDDMWQLTGTPVTRYFDDLWTQLRSARPDILKHYKVYEYENFCRVFCKTKTVRDSRGSLQRVISGNQNHELLEKLLASCYVIRRKLVDVVDDLPPVTHRTVGTSYSGVGQMPALAMDDLMAALNDPASEYATMRRVLGVAKVKSILDYVHEYGQKPYLIGYWHKDVALELKLGLSEAVIVDGSTSTADRERIKDAFNAGEIPVLLGQMQAMSTSWNLQEACSHVIIAEELPSPAMLHQFYSRVYRRGQKRHVQVDHMRSEHDLDIAMKNIRERKDDDNNRVNL